VPADEDHLASLLQSQSELAARLSEARLTQQTDKKLLKETLVTALEQSRAQNAGLRKSIEQLTHALEEESRLREAAETQRDEALHIMQTFKRSDQQKLTIDEYLMQKILAAEQECERMKLSMEGKLHNSSLSPSHHEDDAEIQQMRREID